MAKKGDELADLLLMLPWWVDVALAAVAYVGLKWLLPALEFESPIARPLVGVASQLAPFVALLLLCSALFSALRSWKRRRLLEEQTGLESIRALPWRAFEQLVGEAWRRQGYTVRETGSAGGDGGVDVVVEKGGNTYLIQCKNWKARKLGVKVVREMYGIMADRHAAGVIIVISGMFTQGARTFAMGKPIDLVEGRELLSLVQQVQVSEPATESDESAAFQPEAVPPAPPATADTQCPRCGGQLVLRTAGRGKHAGSQFWGCSGYPKCRFKRPLG